MGIFALAIASSVAASPASATCYCTGPAMDQTDVPSEGLVLLPADSCSNESRSIWITDGEGLGVGGSIDTSIDEDTDFGKTYWRADAPLTPGVTYTVYHVVKDSVRGFDAPGCETTASLTVREGAFPEMGEPVAAVSDLQAVWVPQFACYAPAFLVTLTKRPESEDSSYERYTLSVVRGEEANVAKWQLGSGAPTFDHYADWSTGWTAEVPYQDDYCIRAETWEIVNGTGSFEDLCVLPEDLVGVQTNGGWPDETVPADAALCDASTDITSPVTDVFTPPAQNDPEPTDGDDGCSQGRPGGALPALLLWCLLALRLRRSGWAAP